MSDGSTSNTVYLDYNATSPIHPAVREELIRAFDYYANPSSLHSLGRDARKKVEEARGSVADFIGADPASIVFTGGGSESNNTVLKITTCNESLCSQFRENRNRLVTSAIEHPSVLYTARAIELAGTPVSYVGVDSTGKIRMNELEGVLSDDVVLVSIMYANNEIGTIQDIETITRMAHDRGALVHTDAVQAVGKIPVDARKLGVDFMSLSAHKFGGPKGIGVLYVKNGVPYPTLIHGGHQEEGRRAGTLNTQGIIGIGKAAEVAASEFAETSTRILHLRNRLREGIEDSIPDIHVNGHVTDYLPGTLNVSFKGAEGEAILLYLDLEGIAVSTGSACASGSLDPSHVLLATGVGAELAHGSIRFSLGPLTTADEVEYVIEKIPPIISRIRSMSTVYSSRGAGA